MITHIQKCSCGAITVTYDNGASNSMFQSTFKQLKLDVSGAVILPISCCCDHCVNHWGIDLCECGSGEIAGKCGCGSKKAHDLLGVKYDSFGIIIKNMGL